MKSLAEFMDGLKIVTLTGGTDVRIDAMKLSEGAQVIIGTPGRITHMLGTQALSRPLGSLCTCPLQRSTT